MGSRGTLTDTQLLSEHYNVSNTDFRKPKQRQQQTNRLDRSSHRLRHRTSDDPVKVTLLAVRQKERKTEVLKAKEAMESRALVRSNQRTYNHFRLAFLKRMSNRKKNPTHS